MGVTDRSIRVGPPLWTCLLIVCLATVAPASADSPQPGTVQARASSHAIVGGSLSGSTELAMVLALLGSLAWVGALRTRLRQSQGIATGIAEATGMSVAVIDRDLHVLWTSQMRGRWRLGRRAAKPHRFEDDYAQGQTPALPADDPALRTLNDGGIHSAAIPGPAGLTTRRLTGPLRGRDGNVVGVVVMLAHSAATSERPPSTTCGTADGVCNG